MLMATLQQTVSDIKSLKIQGSQTIAEAALKAWAAAKDKKKASKLLKDARPTEPMLFKALRAVETGADSLKLIEKFKKDRQKIANFGASLIKNNSIVFTHCHSSTVIDILKAAKAQGKKFVVHNTETRPMFQGRITAIELAKAKIPVKHFIDSAAMLAMKDADIMLIGADWISQKGVANKIGTEMFAEIATKYFKIPVYCCSHSWKYSDKSIVIEQRPASEVWTEAPKNIQIYNPAFEIAESKHIKGIISEFGMLNYKDFLKRMTW
jgi:ribose 1,5-bisphosphate isomerase